MNKMYANKKPPNSFNVLIRFDTDSRFYINVKIYIYKILSQSLFEKIIYINMMLQEIKALTTYKF